MPITDADLVSAIKCLPPQMDINDIACLIISVMATYDLSEDEKQYALFLAAQFPLSNCRPAVPGN